MKSLTVKDWFADKLAKELKMKMFMCDVFAVIKETEKAYYAMMNIGVHKFKTTWVPKSVIIEHEVGKDDTGKMHHETLFDIEYEEAVSEFHRFWRQYE